MQQRVRAIVLSRMKYSESSQIVRCFTDLFGPVSILISGLGSKKGTKLGFIQPLSRVEFSMRPPSSQKLIRPRGLAVLCPASTIPFDVVKSTQAIFLAEIFERSLQAHEADADIFNFLMKAIETLDAQEPNANLHLIIMANLAIKLGFAPDLSGLKNVVLSGELDSHWLNPEHQLNKEESQLFRQAFGTKLEAIDGPNFGREGRRKLLRILVEYYHLHLIGEKDLRSVGVLEELMN